MADELVFIERSTIEAIAAATKEKSGNSNAMFPKDIPNYIRSINTSSGYSNVPSDIVAEAKRVANVMIPNISERSLTFIAMSDMHELGDSDHDNPSIIECYRRANRNAGQGAKIISDIVPLDFFVNLGDLAWGNTSKTTTYDLISSIMRARGYTAELENSVESLFTPGNHDVKSVSGFLDPDVVTGLTSMYRYVDFSSKKVRVICLDTADTTDSTTGTERVSGEQLQWFADALDLSDKSDVTEWGIIVLSHHPLDWGVVKPLTTCLSAYLSGTNYSTTHDGISVSHDYTGKNGAKFIANFHGHVHCFKVANINGTTVKRIAIPNACHGRSNEYGTLGNTEFGETTTYNKTDNHTGKNTSFCLISIDLDAEIIYAYCFGAGYDRTISYGEVEVITYSVTNNLSNAVNNNTAESVTHGSSYAASISPESGYEVDTITVTMGGTDITSSAVKGNVISIPSVTGNIVISVTTTVAEDFEYGEFTNLVPLSQERDSTAIYNGVGYKNGVYASETTDGTDADTVCTGWIPYTWNPDNALYIKGATLDTSNSHVRIFGFQEKTYVEPNVGYSFGDRIDTNFNVEVLGDKYYKVTPKTVSSTITHIRISLVGTGEKLIVTINEPIHAESPEEVNYTNLVPTSLDYDLDGVFNSVGYKDGYYSSTESPYYKADSVGSVVTGLIPYDFLGEDGAGSFEPPTIYIKGVTFDNTQSHNRMGLFRDDTKIMYSTPGVDKLKEYFTIDTLGTQYYRLTPIMESGRSALARVYVGQQISHIAISANGKGSNMIVTLDEEIT